MMEWLTKLTGELTRNESITLWLGVFLGALVSVALFLLDKLFSDLWYRLPFLWGRHSASLTGQAIRVHSLSGTANLRSGPTPLDLAKWFPPPMPHDGNEFLLEDISLRTKWNHEALLRGRLKWSHDSQEWAAPIVGRGRYFPKKYKELSGYVYLVCEFKGTAKPGPGTETWQCAYMLRNKTDRSGGWEGVWTMFDSERPDHGKFGTIDLHPPK